jgi:hypothetical protein
LGLASRLGAGAANTTPKKMVGGFGKRNFVSAVLYVSTVPAPSLLVAKKGSSLLPGSRYVRDEIMNTYKVQAKSHGNLHQKATHDPGACTSFVFSISNWTGVLAAEGCVIAIGNKPPPGTE